MSRGRGRSANAVGARPIVFALVAALCLCLAWCALASAAASSSGHPAAHHGRHHHKRHHRTRHHHSKHRRAGSGIAAPSSSIGLLAGLDTKAPLGSQEIAPYSKHPSETRPFEICPPPTKTRASCLAIGAPNPGRLEAQGLPVPSLEGSGEAGGFSPADLRSAYKLPPEGGEGMTVAITIAYDDPKAEADLAIYRETYGLPKCTKESGCFAKVNQKGEEANYPEPNSGWALETSLDLDMVSAACPKCHILLIEANTNEIGDLGVAVEKAAAMGADAISDSWGIANFPYGSSYNHYFKHPGIPVLFASGDYGYAFYEGGFGHGAIYPSASPDVIAVGGTALHKDENSRGWTESAWSGAGSGCSEYEEKPAWQMDEICPKRTAADVSAVADPETPVSVYDSFEASGWWDVGGTSASTPLLAGIEAISSKYARSLPGGDLFYADTGELFDVTSGNNSWAEVCAAPAENPFGRDYLCNAKVGYDGPTGNGTPNGPFEVTALPPIAVTRPSTAVSTGAATLHGGLDPQGQATTYRFEYGTTTSYGTNVPVPDASAGSGTEASEVSREISGLAANTTYHYRLTATNAAGTSHGADRTFRTATPTVISVSPGSGPAAGGTTVTIKGSNFAAVSAVKFGTVAAESFKVESETSISAVAPSPTGGLGPFDVTVTTPAGTSATSEADRFTDKLAGPGRAWGGGLEGELGNRHSQTVNTPVEIFGLPSSTMMASGGFASASLTPSGTVMGWGENWVGELGNGAGAGQVSFVPVKVCAVGVTECPNGPYLEGVTAIAAGSNFTLALLNDGTVVGWGQNYEGQLGSGNRTECHGEFVCSRTPVHVCTVMESPCKSEHYLRGVTAIAAGGWHSLALLEDGTVMAWGLSEQGQLGNGSFTGPEMCGGFYPCSQVPEQVAALSKVAAISAGGESSYALLKDGTVKAWGENGRGQLGDGTTTNRDEPVAVCASGEKAPCTHDLAGVAQITSGWNDGYALLESGVVVDWGQNFLGQLGIGTVTGEGCNCISTPVQVSGLSGVTAIGAGSFGSDSLALLKNGQLMSWGTGGLGDGQSGADKGHVPVRVCATFAAGPCPSGPHLDEEGRISAMEIGDAGLINVSSASEWQLHASPNVEGSSESALAGTSCVSSTSCEAVGSDANSAGVGVTLAEHWNGSEWSIQSTPNPNAAKSSELEAVSCISASSCEATGSYENSSGVKVALAERWNGSEWSLQQTAYLEGAKEAKLSGVSCASATACTAVGNYKNASGTHLPLAEHWDGTRWEAQTMPNPEGSQNTILYSVSCTSATACEAAGYYVQTKGGAAPLAERWDGAKWTVQSTPNPAGSQDSYLTGVSCSTANACTATGLWVNASSTTVTLAERWDGSKWAIQSTPNPEGAEESELIGVSCTSVTACAATGAYINSSGVQVPLAEAWNGSKWETQSAPSPAGAKAAFLYGGVSCASSSACVSAGSYENGSGVQATLAERWSGSKWEAQTPPNRDGSGQGDFNGEPSCASALSCEAVGGYVNGSESERPLAEHWNGLEWTLQWAPSPAGAKEAGLISTSCPSTSECAAVGHYENASGTWLPLAERLVGGEWAIQSTPNPEGATATHLTSVSCASATTCMATGYYKNASGVWVALSERWKGTSWTLQSMPNPSGAKETKPESVSCVSSSFCKATGYYVNSSGVHVSLAEAWNGTSWEVQSTPNPEGAKDTRLFGVSCSSIESCRAVGYYQNASGVNTAFTESWSSKWELQTVPAPEGAKEAELYGMSCPSSTSCRATGWYRNGAGEDVSFAEHWNGTSWSLESMPAPVGSQGTYLGSVSCPTATVCIGTGYYLDGSAVVPLAASLGDLPPVVASYAAAPVTYNGATLNGVVNPNGSGTEYFFEYGSTTSYGSKTAVGYASGTSTLERSKAISGLEAGHTYHFRIVATNSVGTTQGEDQVFTTVKPPAATTEAATSVKSTSATLNASVNPEGLETTYQFEYGETISYGFKVPASPKSVGSGTANVAVSEAIKGLEGGTTYHYRVVATSEAGTTIGKDSKFTTSAPTWILQSTPNPSSNAYLEDVSCASASECIAVGKNGTASLAQRWNGSEWSTMTSPAEGSTLTDVSCVSTTYCVAVPESSTLKAQRWNGSEWTIVTAPAPAGSGATPMPYDVSCASSTSCIMVGKYGTPTGESRALAELWNGSEWTILATPFVEGGTNNMTAVSCISSTSCTAIGMQGGKAAAFRWNGSEWSSLAAPKEASNTLAAGISCTSANACTVIPGANAKVERWNGSEWSVVTVPTPEGGSSVKLNGVSCASATACTAVGSYTKESKTLTLAESWDGSKWSVQTTPNPEPGGPLSGVSCSSASKCTAAGSYSPKKGENKTLAERYE
jgi:alpha-tubulin suppressor-like RCC1 family protein